MPRVIFQMEAEEDEENVKRDIPTGVKSRVKSAISNRSSSIMKHFKNSSLYRKHSFNKENKGTAEKRILYLFFALKESQIHEDIWRQRRQFLCVAKLNFSASTKHAHTHGGM